MAKIGLPKGSGKRLKVREKSVKSQGILKWILSGNPARLSQAWPFVLSYQSLSCLHTPDMNEDSDKFISLDP